MLLKVFRVANPKCFDSVPAESSFHALQINLSLSKELEL
jgi:hypothetical protein